MSGVFGEVVEAMVIFLGGYYALERLHCLYWAFMMQTISRSSHLFVGRVRFLLI